MFVNFSELWHTGDIRDYVYGIGNCSHEQYIMPTLTWLGTVLDNVVSILATCTHVHVHCTCTCTLYMYIYTLYMYMYVEFYIEAVASKRR